jgi:hypothetical protein
MKISEKNFLTYDRLELSLQIEIGGTRKPYTRRWDRYLHSIQIGL